MDVSHHQRNTFQEAVWEYYQAHGRSNLPWRKPEADGTFSPYKIMVSELMLQQTQVKRVIPKYEAFLTTFPTIADLAAAGMGDVLRAWQGLGYNRRAKFLWQAAGVIAASGTFPTSLETLVTLPGIGPNTAGAILAYSFNEPVVFIETNIRTVYIHHFFLDHPNTVSDKALQAVIEQTLDTEHPREWYWALMDYGSHLKATVGNLNKVSTSYKKQSSFQGSRRQVRGQIIRELGNQPYTVQELKAIIVDERLERVINELLQEGLIREKDGVYSLD